MAETMDEPKQAQSRPFYADRVKSARLQFSCVTRAVCLWPLLSASIVAPDASSLASFAHPDGRESICSLMHRYGVIKSYRYL